MSNLGKYVFVSIYLKKYSIMIKIFNCNTKFMYNNNKN